MLNYCDYDYDYDSFFFNECINFNDFFIQFSILFFLDHFEK